MQSFGVIASSLSGSFRPASRTGSPGHFQSLNHREDRAANDRLPGTADVARRLRKVTKSPKRSLKGFSCRPASAAYRMSAAQGNEPALPTQCSRSRKQTSRSALIRCTSTDPAIPDPCSLRGLKQILSSSCAPCQSTLVPRARKCLALDNRQEVVALKLAALVLSMEEHVKLEGEVSVFQSGIGSLRRTPACFAIPVACR